MPILGSGLIKRGVPYATKVINIPNCIAYWKLIETSGTVAADSSGAASRDGTYTNGPTLASVQGPSVAMGSAPLFDGVNDYVEVFTAGLAGAFTPNAFFMGGWFKVAAGFWTDATEHYMMAARTDGTNTLFIRKATTNNTVLFRHIGAGTTKDVSVDITSIGGFSTTAWHHYGLWNDGSGVKAYIDGVQVGTTQTSPGTMTSPITSARLGMVPQAAVSPYVGYIAHVAWFARALTALEITTLATAV
jgi:hypothetical protein